MPRLLIAGWLLVAVDAGYWLWFIGHAEDAPGGGWLSWLNLFTYVGGIVLFVALTLWSLAVATGEDRSYRRRLRRSQ
jgi:hypothetical protein